MQNSFTYRALSIKQTQPQNILAYRSAHVITLAGEALEAGDVFTYLGSKISGTKIAASD